MVAVEPLEQDFAADERRFALYGVPWWTYVALRDALDDRAGVKMTYLAGALELISPSTLHEEAKKIIARLLETWALEHNVDVWGYGGATFRREAKERGLEPDECYTLRRLEEDGVPDIAIEVVVTSPLVDKMAVYAGLSVPEVWEWRPTTKRIAVHRLVGDRYEVGERSGLLPGVDLVDLASFVRLGVSLTQLAREYQAQLRARPA